MSGWDQFDQSLQKRQSQKRRVTTMVLVGFIGAMIAIIALVPLLIGRQPDPINLSELEVEQTQIEEDAPRAAEDSQAAVAEPAENSPTTFTSDLTQLNSAEEASSEVIAERLERLENNLLSRDVSFFQKPEADSNRGPRRIEYMVSGSGQSHGFNPGQATFGETDIVGAAGEWFVRPWWKPGWVPNSVDCGEIGTAAIAGHVSWAGRPGPFHDLGAMVEGDQIRCQANNGQWFTYAVTEVVRIDYTNTDYYWQSLEENTAELTLFSCTPEITGIVVVRATILN